MQEEIYSDLSESTAVRDATDSNQSVYGRDALGSQSSLGPRFKMSLKRYHLL